MVLANIAGITFDSMAATPATRYCSYRSIDGYFFPGGQPSFYEALVVG